MVPGVHDRRVIVGPVRSGVGVGRGVGAGVGRGVGVGRGLGEAQTAPTGQGVAAGEGLVLGGGDWHTAPIGHGGADSSPGLWVGQPTARANPGGQSGVGEIALVGAGDGDGQDAA